MYVFFIFNNRIGGFMKNKVRKIVGIVLLFILLVFIKDRMENRIFYDFKSLIRNEYRYIHNVSVSDMGPHCIIDIYLKKGNYEFDKIEPVFIYTINQATKEPYYTYFLKHHIKNASCEFAYFHIAFRKQGDDNNELCRFNSRDSDNHFQKWELDGNEKQCYYVSDYTDEYHN